MTKSAFVYARLVWRSRRASVEHLVGHVQADGPARRSDAARGDEDVGAGARAEVEHRLARMKVSDGGRERRSRAKPRRRSRARRRSPFARRARRRRPRRRLRRSSSPARSRRTGGPGRRSPVQQRRSARGRPPGSRRPWRSSARPRIRTCRRRRRAPQHAALSPGSQQVAWSVSVQQAGVGSVSSAMWSAPCRASGRHGVVGPPVPALDLDEAGVDELVACGGRAAAARCRTADAARTGTAARRGGEGRRGC